MNTNNKSKYKYLLIIVIFLLFSCAKQEQRQEEVGEEKMVESNNSFKLNGIEIKWIDHASFKINYTKLIYTDPFKLEGALEPADIILITHEHFDHCSPEDIKKIAKDDTLIFTTPDCLSKLSRTVDKGKTVVVKPGSRINVTQNIQIETIPAYNTNKFRSPGIPYHPKDNDWVGYIISINGKRIYQAGDTDFIPEMRNLKNISVAIVPVGGTYTMTAEEAANAVNTFKPETAIPMHYGEIVGSSSDAEKFKVLSKVKTVILKKSI